MAASDNVSDRILNNIDAATLKYIDDTFANLWGAISVSFRNILVLWIILYGLAIWRGLVKTPVQEFAWTMLKFAVIYGLISTWDLFSDIVVPFITNTPDAMAGVISGGGTGTTASRAIGDVYIAAIAVADNAMGARGWFMPYLLGGLILLAATLMMIYALFLIALSKIALAVLVGLGPLFILMLMFKQTQKVFEAWLQQVINYMLIVILTVGVLALMETIAANAVKAIPEDGISLGDVMPAAMTFLITFLLLTQVMTIASALGGGIALTTQNVGAIVGTQASQYISRGGKLVGTQASQYISRGGKLAGTQASQYISRGGKLAGRGIRSGATRGWSAVKNRFNRRTVAPKP